MSTDRILILLRMLVLLVFRQRAASKTPAVWFLPPINQVLFQLFSPKLLLLASEPKGTFMTLFEAESVAVALWPHVLRTHHPHVTPQGPLCKQQASTNNFWPNGRPLNLNPAASQHKHDIINSLHHICYQQAYVRSPGGPLNTEEVWQHQHIISTFKKDSQFPGPKCGDSRAWGGRGEWGGKLNISSLSLQNNRKYTEHANISSKPNKMQSWCTLNSQNVQRGYMNERKTLQICTFPLAWSSAVKEHRTDVEIWESVRRPPLRPVTGTHTHTNNPWMFCGLFKYTQQTHSPGNTLTPTLTKQPPHRIRPKPMPRGWRRSVRWQETE